MTTRQGAGARLPAAARGASEHFTLSAAPKPGNPKRRNAAIAAGNVAAVTALDVITARQLPA